MNPVLEGYITYADLKNGTLNLFDIYQLNQLIKYKAEQYKKRVREAAVRKAINGKKG